MESNVISFAHLSHVMKNNPIDKDNTFFTFFFIDSKLKHQKDSNLYKVPR